MPSAISPRAFGCPAALLRIATPTARIGPIQTMLPETCSQMSARSMVSRLARRGRRPSRFPVRRGRPASDAASTGPGSALECRHDLPGPLPTRAPPSRPAATARSTPALRAPPRRRALARAATTPTSSSSTAPAGGFVFDEGILKSGLARRVDGPRRPRAARRRDRVRLHGGARLGGDEARGRDRRADRDGRRRHRRRSSSARAPSPRRYELDQPSRSTCRASTSARCSSAPARRRTPTTRAIIKVEASFAEEIREILVATSDGMMVARRAAAHALRRARHRRARRQAPGGLERRRRAHDDRLLRRQVARVARARGGAAGDRHARRARGARRARWRSCSRPATAASSCTRRSATASRPTSTARARATTPARSASRSPASSAPSSTTRRSLQSRGSINVDDEGNEPQRSVLIENGKLARLHARPALGAKHYKLDADRQRPPRELRAARRCRA